MFLSDYLKFFFINTIQRAFLLFYGILYVYVVTKAVLNSIGITQQKTLNSIVLVFVLIFLFKARYQKTSCKYWFFISPSFLSLFLFVAYRSPKRKLFDNLIDLFNLFINRSSPKLTVIFLSKILSIYLDIYSRSYLR